MKFIWVLIMLSGNSQDGLSVSGEGHFDTEMACEEAAKIWRPKVEPNGILVLCISTR